MQFDRIGFVDVGPPGGDGRRIEGLRVAFRVIKTADRSANVLNVDVYNVSPSTRALLERAGNRLVLYAGYRQDEVRVLAIGDITNYETTANGPDNLTKVIAGDGLIALSDIRVSLSYGENTEAETVARDVAEQMGLDDVEINADLAKPYRSGYSYCGRAADALDEISDRCGFVWSVQNNGLQVLERGQSSDREAVVLARRTGLLQVKPMQELDGQLFTAPPENGLYIETLLNPRIEPGTDIVVESRDYDGVQLVAQSVTHVGDTRGPGGAWRTIIEARGL